ncbi:PfkB family carbohydrate kinase [Sorangium sp. So ce291]|uniref:PfkB family carbohydrate kinase n=1 Tax=Sorangium sp. So ce291 TaxID=3133294 RepID=UPI003F60DC0A
MVVGMGARGCALATRDGVRYFPPVALDLPVVDTNGAGDGLAVGFLVSHVLEGASAAGGGAGAASEGASRSFGDS